MTLITYLTRVHFADGVLEEALWSELKINHKKRPLIVTEPAQIGGDMFERILGSLPARSSHQIFHECPPIPSEAGALALADVYRRTNSDLLLAFGGSSAIDLARASRIVLMHEKPLSLISYARGARKSGYKLPDLYVIPGIDGFGSSVSAHASVLVDDAERALLISSKLLPSMTIYDPTLTLGSTQEASASSGADAIANCMEAYAASGYNPPADGIAFDGLGRAVRNIHQVLKDDRIELRREMMAASLNGSLALQKGPGAVQAIVNALQLVTDKALDPGAVSRLALPGVLRFSNIDASDKCESLAGLFGAKSTQSLADSLEAFLSDLPLPRKLSDMNIGQEHIEAAAPLAARDLSVVAGRHAARRKDLLTIMEAVL